ncbi:MAG: hypothetical protein WCV80_01130 [Candidatus Paceibacterota bacterium]|jgi:hypothetical protein
MSIVLARIVVWIREHQKAIFFWFLLFLVGSLGFAVGYLMAHGEIRAPIIIEKCSK